MPACLASPPSDEAHQGALGRDEVVLLTVEVLPGAKRKADGSEHRVGVKAKLCKPSTPSWPRPQWRPQNAFTGVGSK